MKKTERNLKELNKKVKKYVGKGTQSALNKFLDTQEYNLNGLFGNTIN